MLPHLLEKLRGALSRTAATADASATEAHRLFDAGNFAGARAAYDDLIRAGGPAGLLVNRGYCELALGDTATARASFRAAIDVAPHLGEAWVGLGDAAAESGNNGEALRCYDSALELDSAMPAARNNRAQTLTTLGRLPEAWRDGEARWELANAASLYPHRLALPRWDGSPGRRVLVHWEQGFGDIIQHLRFLPAVAARSAACRFECPPPLAALARRMDNGPQVIDAGNAAPDTAGFDCCAPLLSLPLLLGANPSALPRPPYLRADPTRATVQRGAWRGGKPRPLVGIAWRASSFDTRRSLALEDMLRLTEGAGAPTLVSLQKDITAAEQELMAAHGVINAGSTFHDFDATAMAISALDAVVSVDTAVAHLSGALAMPTWVLLNEPAAARWMLGRGDSPWYPSMRLLRKHADAPWGALVADAARALPGAPR